VSSRVAKNGRYYLELKVTNRSKTPAFGIRSRLIDAETQQRVLPVFMNTNYLILMPGETRFIHFEFDDNAHQNARILAKAKQYGYPEILVE
jgi:hypothetical protein